MVVTPLLVILALADIYLIFAFFRLQGRQSASQDVLRELTEERAMVAEMRTQIKFEMTEALARVKQLKDQVQVLATEAEQEVRQGLSEITKEVEVIVSNISAKLDAPMVALNQKQHFIAQIAKDARQERELLGRMVARAENAAKLLKAGASWEDVVDQFEQQRFADIRAMLARGVKIDKIASELGVSEQEVRIVSGAL